MTGQHTITLNDYQVANLRAAIEATGFWGKPGGQVPGNPLSVLQSGDWIGELYWLLPAVAYQPNASPEELAKRAREWNQHHPME